MARQTSFRDLQQQLLDLAQRGDDASPLLPKIAADFHRAEAAQFASGRGWKPLSDAYLAQKAREGKSRQIGVYSGRLRASLIGGGDSFSIERFTRDKSFVIGSSDPVANLFAGKHRHRRQPSRKPVRLTPSTRRTWLGWVQDFLVDGST